MYLHTQNRRQLRTPSPTDLSIAALLSFCFCFCFYPTRYGRHNKSFSYVPLFKTKSKVKERSVFISPYSIGLWSQIMPMRDMGMTRWSKSLQGVFIEFCSTNKHTLLKLNTRKNTCLGVSAIYKVIEELLQNISYFLTAYISSSKYYTTRGLIFLAPIVQKIKHLSALSPPFVGLVVYDLFVILLFYLGTYQSEIVSRTTKLLQAIFGKIVFGIN